MTEIEADRLLSGERSGRSSDIQPYAWVILLVAYLASVMAPLNQTKVPPLMPVLMDAFQINLTQAGSLMSVFGGMGFLLALPAGWPGWGPGSPG